MVAGPPARGPRGRTLVIIHALTSAHDTGLLSVEQGHWTLGLGEARHESWMRQGDGPGWGSEVDWGAGMLTLQRDHLNI